MKILSPDTNIFVRSYLVGDIKALLIIGHECKNTPSVIVKSVREEFLYNFTKAQAIMETFILNISGGKTINQAINGIDANTTLFDLENIKKGLSFLGFQTKDLEKDEEKRFEFLNNVTQKLNQIKQDFLVESIRYFWSDEQLFTKIDPVVQKLAPDFNSLNQKFGLNKNGKNPLHQEDQKHWIRTALFKKEKNMIFLTVDYFGFGQNSQKATHLKQEIKELVNSTLETNFEIEFR